MRVPPISVLHLLVVCHLSPVAQARVVPINGIAVPHNVSHADPLPSLDHRGLGKRSEAMTIHGLGPLWQGVFRSVRSIQPPLPISAFSQFFLQVARIARSDTVPARPYQRFQYGALILEIMSQTSGAVPVPVTNEFVEGAALWLYNEAQNGWTNLFEAWFIDKRDHEVVCIRVANTWDTWIKPTLDDMLEGLESVS